MTIVLDTGGVEALAGRRALLTELRNRDEWPPLVPSIVMTEALTGDHRRDFHANRLLGLCLVVDVTAEIAREAAALRGRVPPGHGISATDAVVAAVAVRQKEATVLTSDVGDLRLLLDGAHARITVARA